ncbi:hypothetical protein FRX31_020268 [Thalictrum thalictroides]|uniref:Expansin-like EG45 domain-containing protein n=1 Tax=Thalictrum thalictroides TaxID=46969 RepID=A0A7J6VYD1_THATH|nr:hypothetical protein FRX31_020268 [Thalictrum thalictroides]
MSKLHLLLQRLFLLSLTACYHVCYGDVGTAAQYSPPYLPTECYGQDISQFPANNMFASASDGIWNNGAACGRQYLVRCLSATVRGTCIDGQTIQIRIVDRAATSVSRPSSSGTTMVLSASAFAMIAASSASEINIEFQQI